MQVLPHSDWTGLQLRSSSGSPGRTRELKTSFLSSHILFSPAVQRALQSRQETRGGLSTKKRWPAALAAAMDQPDTSCPCHPGCLDWGEHGMHPRSAGFTGETAESPKIAGGLWHEVFPVDTALILSLSAEGWCVCHISEGTGRWYRPLMLPLTAPNQGLLPFGSGPGSLFLHFSLQ